MNILVPMEKETELLRGGKREQSIQTHKGICFSHRLHLLIRQMVCRKTLAEDKVIAARGPCYEDWELVPLPLMEQGVIQ